MNSPCVFILFGNRKSLKSSKKTCEIAFGLEKIGESLVTSGRSGWGKNIADLCFHNFLIEILCFHKFLIQNFVETQFSNRGTYQEIVFVQKKLKIVETQNPDFG